MRHFRSHALRLIVLLCLIAAPGALIYMALTVALTDRIAAIGVLAIAVLTAKATGGLWHDYRDII